MAAEEMQQMAPEQAMEADQAMMNQGQAQYPQQMPSGAPVASPETMDQMPPAGAMPPPEMMQQPGMMAYGGMPYAVDGIIMGGTNMPFIMQYGGDLETFQGTNNSQVTVNNIPATRTTAAPTDKGWTAGTPTGATGKNAQGWSRTTRAEGEAVKYYTGKGGGTEKGVAQGICAKINKSGNVEEAILNAFPAYLKGKRPGDSGYEEAMAAAVAKLSANPLYKDCIAKANEKFEKKEALFMDEEEPAQDCPPCIDPKTGQPAVDANGQPIVRPKDPETGECSPCEDTPPGKKMCKCEDPVTGEVKEFPIEQEEECVCEGGERGEVGGGGGMIMDQPHWSVNAQANVLRNQMMATEPAPGNVVLPPSVQTKGAYEEYQTKVDQALAATNQAAGAVMSGTSGSTGRKQARLKDIIGQGLRGAMDAVANVQSRNVDRQRETNVQDATITNTNNLARADILNTGLQGQEGRGNTRIVNRNKKLYNKVGSVIDANNDMVAKFNANTTTPQYAAEYDYGMVYPTGVEKPLTGATGATLDDLTRKHVEKGVPYKDAYTLALREMKSKYGGQRMKNGGYVWVDNIYPFE
jgi:hypothetical protein